MTADRRRVLLVLAAFAAIYVVWGSTYLAIRYAVETLPPFLMAATRFLIAGAALLGWARLRGAPAPTRAQWRVATYAFVNPVIAVLIGWAAGGESLGPRVLLASALVVAAVALIVTADHGEVATEAP